MNRVRGLWLIGLLFSLLPEPRAGCQVPQKLQPARNDRQGNPLPDGALARLGALRWRAPGDIAALAFSPDGNKLVSLVSPGPFYGLSSFDVTNGKITKHFPLEFPYHHRIAISPDGSRVICSSHGHGMVQIFALPSGRGIRNIPRNERAQWIGWSDSGQPLAVFLRKDIILRELMTGKEQSFKADDLPESPSVLTGCAFAPAGKVLAVPGIGIIHVWNTVTGKECNALKTANEQLRGLALSADGRLLAALFHNEIANPTVQLWDLATGKVLHTLSMERNHVGAVAFAPDGKTLATIGWKAVSFWDVATGSERGRTQGVRSFAETVAFSPDSKTLATVERHSCAIHVWDLATATLKPEPLQHSNAVCEIAFSPDGRRLATGGGMDGTIIVWDMKTAEPLLQIRRSEWLRDCAFILNGRSLLSLWSEAKWIVSDTVTGQQLDVVTLADPESPATRQSGEAMVLSADRTTLVVFSAHYPKKGGAAMLEASLVTGWDTTTRQQLFRRRCGPYNWGFAVSPDVKSMAVATDGASSDKGPEGAVGHGSMRLESTATGEHLLSFPILSGQSFPLSFSPDGRLLASITLDHAIREHQPITQILTLRLWELVTAAEVLALPTKSNCCIALSPDGRVIAIADPSHEILLWDLHRSVALCRFKGSAAQITKLVFSPNGSCLVSGLADSTVLVWDIAGILRTAKSSPLDVQVAVQAWVDLGADSRKAFAARGALVESVANAMPLLKERLQPAPVLDAPRALQLIGELDNPRFAARKQAMSELEALAELAEPALREALKGKPSLEVRQRIAKLLENLKGPINAPDQLRALRAIAVLEHIGTPEARLLLERLAAGTPEARQTQAANASLKRLVRREQNAR